MSKESWNNRISLIMAVTAGSVGFGNFLRFPGQVAQFGGGAFMIAYFISFIIIGLPIGWNRNKCLVLLFIITLIGSSLVFFFTEDLKFMNVLNFWVGDLLIFIFAPSQRE